MKMKLPTIARYILNVLLISLSCLFSINVFAATEIIYYHNDALGSPVAATDENGDVIWTEDYAPYGEKLSDDMEAIIEKVGYTGHRYDNDTGLVYAGARMYDPSLGRFIGIDPVGAMAAVNNPVMFNRYAYGNNNPYKYVDPDGELSIRAISMPNKMGGLYIRFDIHDSNSDIVEEPVKMLLGRGFSTAKKLVKLVSGGEGILDFYPDAVGPKHNNPVGLVDVVELDKKLSPFLVFNRRFPTPESFLDTLNNAIKKAGCPNGCGENGNPVRKEFERVYGRSTKDFVEKAITNQKKSKDPSI